MAKRKHDILALERVVKEVYAQDPSNPELYTAIKNLAEAILVVKGMTFNHREADEISHNLATDFYIKINHQGLKVKCWTKYIRLRLYSFRSAYLKETSNTEFVIDDLVDAERMRDMLYPQNRETEESYRYSELESVIDSLPTKIMSIFDKYVRYEVDSNEYNKVLASVQLSISMNGGFDIDKVILFELDDSYECYVKFMINLISKRLAVYLHKICGDELSRRTELNELIYSYNSFLDN